MVHIKILCYCLYRYLILTIILIVIIIDIINGFLSPPLTLFFSESSVQSKYFINVVSLLLKKKKLHSLGTQTDTGSLSLGKYPWVSKLCLSFFISKMGMRMIRFQLCDEE